LTCPYLRWRERSLIILIHKGDSIKLLSVANCSPIKGMDTLIEAIHRLDNPKITLDVVGDDNFEPGYCKRIKIYCLVPSSQRFINITFANSFLTPSHTRLPLSPQRVWELIYLISALFAISAVSKIRLFLHAGNGVRTRDFCIMSAAP
jgi:glycosyltransferase involved in cell wall biosynthesis